MIDFILSYRGDVPIKRLCQALNVPRSTVLRKQRASVAVRLDRKPHPRSLTPEERQQVRDVLYSEPFRDRAPAEVVATLLDQGQYLCSERTMYRVLKAQHPVQDRRRQRTHPEYKKPELVALQPNRVWSWDITKLHGPSGVHYHLYVILDIFSRYVVAWMVAERESADLAQRLIHQACSQQNIDYGHLTLHADRGSSMASWKVAQLLACLGVYKSHGRPRVSNDNPYSESQFKTLKYWPDFPDRFHSQHQALDFCRRFFAWYNHEHRHSGIAYLTPYDVHTGQTAAVLSQRQTVLEAAHNRFPDRFLKRRDLRKSAPTEAWINRPEEEPSK